MTLETLRALRAAVGVSKQEFASYCTPEILRWSRAAGESERIVNEMHRKLESGWRAELPWLDARAGLPADDDAEERELDFNVFAGTGVRVYAYRPPYEHQRIMASVCLSLDGVAIMGDVGTGKTRAAIESFGHLQRTDQLDFVVVTGRKSTLSTVWKRELSEWAEDFRPIVLDGTVEERAAEIQRVMQEDQRGYLPVIILNHEVLARLEPALTKLMQQKRVGFVIDESQKLRNPDAQVTQAGMRLASLARWRLIMSGSPVIQGEQDVWSQWYIVDLGITFGANFVQFRREWLVENPYTFKVSVRDTQAQTEIGLRMRRRGYRVTKEEGIPDLPPRSYQRETITLTSAQQRAYRELQEELITRLSDADEDGRYATAANQLTMILRLTQITSGFVKDDEGRIHRFDPNPKAAALRELVDDNIRNGSIIVWAWYREDVEFLSRMLREYRPSIVYGGQRDRDMQIENFTQRRTRLLIGNPGAGGIGLNLQVAPLAIYYSQGYNLEDRLQSEGRNHRGGSQMHPQITYVDLVAPGTIDEIVLEALQRKKSVADAVVDLRHMIGLDR